MPGTPRRKCKSWLERQAENMTAGEVAERIAECKRAIDEVIRQSREYERLARDLEPYETERIKLQDEIATAKATLSSARHVVARTVRARNSHDAEAALMALTQRSADLEHVIRRTLPPNLSTSSELRLAMSSASLAIARKTQEIECLERELATKQREEASAERQAHERAARHARAAMLRARMAAADNRTRDLGASVKKRLRSHGYCPYCLSHLAAGQEHADHIYPVSLGGRSTPENMVIVCATCNSRKGNLTLREFIERYDLDRSTIEITLSRLGKKF